MAGRSFTLSVSLLLAFPPGLFCTGTSDPCCRAPTVPVCVEKCDRTCHHCPSTPAKSQRTPREAPPCDTACCAFPLIIIPKIDPPDAAAVDSALVISSWDTRTVEARTYSPPRTVACPLYVLNCVWLC